MCICIYVYIMHCTTYIAQHIPYTLCVWHFTNNMCSCRLQTYLSLTSFFWLRVRGGSPLRALQVAACQSRANYVYIYIYRERERTIYVYNVYLYICIYHALHYISHSTYHIPCVPGISLMI